MTIQHITDHNLLVVSIVKNWAQLKCSVEHTNALCYIEVIAELTLQNRPRLTAPFLFLFCSISNHTQCQTDCYVRARAKKREESIDCVTNRPFFTILFSFVSLSVFHLLPSKKYCECDEMVTHCIHSTHVVVQRTDRVSKSREHSPRNVIKTVACSNELKRFYVCTISYKSSRHWMNLLSFSNKWRKKIKRKKNTQQQSRRLLLAD